MKYAFVDAHRDGYSVSRLCRVLGVSRCGYCQGRNRLPSPRAQANAALDAEVAAIYQTSRRSYGRPRIVAQLRSQGKRVGGERVRRSLQRQGLRPVYKRPYRVTTNSDHRLPVAPNLLERCFDGWQPNCAWVSDITFIAIGRLRTDTRTQANVAKRLNDGHSKLEAIRCLKRYIACEAFYIIQRRQREINTTKIAA